MKEKAASYARVPDSTWNKDNRKEVAKSSADETENKGGVGGDGHGEQRERDGHDAPEAGTIPSRGG